MLIKVLGLYFANAKYKSLSECVSVASGERLIICIDFIMKVCDVWSGD